MLPILERLLYRPTHVKTTRVLVVVPTRELAIQVRHDLMSAIVVPVILNSNTI